MLKQQNQRISQNLLNGKIINNGGLRFYTRNDTSDMAVIESLPYYFKHLLPTSHWIDVGAHIGGSAAHLYASNAEVVLSIEPDPLHAALYQYNMSLNDMPCHLICAAAVSDVEEPISHLQLNLTKTRRYNSAMNTLYGFRWKKPRPMLPVPVLTLDDIITYAYERYDEDNWSLKINSEGSELMMVIDQDVVSFFEQLYIEYHLDIQPKIAIAKEAITNLRSLGFTVYHYPKQLPDTEEWEHWPAKLVLHCVRTS